MPIIGSMFQEFTETTGQDPFVHQNKKLLKVHLGYGPINAKTGSMVAYQGDARFANTGTGGLSKMMKTKMTGEGVNVMLVEGTGEVFLADAASEIQIFYLDNDMISINGANVLAFSGSIEWDIHRVNAGGASMMAGGLYNVVLKGTGYVAVTTKGDPVCFDVAQAPTFADAQAVVLWTSGVRMDVKVDSGGLKSMLRGGTGELVQMAFSGQGYVMVQPSESVVAGGHQATAPQSGGGGMLGNLLGG